MSAVIEIQEAIAKLTETERAQLRQWFALFEEDDWDRQITADSASGKLDWMFHDAEKERKAGKLLPLPGEIKDQP